MNKNKIIKLILLIPTSILLAILPGADIRAVMIWFTFIAMRKDIV